MPGWSKSLCSVCRRAGHNKTSCPQRRPLSPIVPANLTYDEAAKAFVAFNTIGERINPLSPKLRFLVLKTLCAFFLEDEATEHQSNEREK